MDPFYPYKPGDNVSRPHGHLNQNPQNSHHPTNASAPSQSVATNYAAQYGVPPASQQQPHAPQTSLQQQQQHAQIARPPSSQYPMGQPLQQTQGGRGIYPYTTGQPSPAMNASAPQASYAVPNPLGGGGGGDSREASKTELLRSMYHQRQPTQQQRGPPTHPSPMPRPPNASPGLPASQPPYGMPGGYQQSAQSTGLQHPTNVHASQQQQQQPPPQQQQQQRSVPPSNVQTYQHANAQNYQANPAQQQQQQPYRQGLPSSQSPGYPPVQTQAPQRHPQMQPPIQNSTNPQQQLQQNYQMQQMQQRQQQQQQQQQRQYTQQMQQSQQQKQQQQHPTMQHAQSQQSHSSQQQQQQSQPQQQTPKERFNLTPEGKIALRDAVISAIRSPTGQIDPVFLQRAVERGLPKQAILNAAVVAIKRDRKNREDREKKRVSSTQSQQPQQVSGGQVPAGTSGQVHPSMARNNGQQNAPQINGSSNIYPNQQSSQIQHQQYVYQQQYLYQQQQQQQQQQQKLQQQQQAKQQEYQQQLLQRQKAQKEQQEQLAAAHRETELKAAAAAAKKKQYEAAERLKKQQLEMQRKLQLEQQKRLIEEERKRKEQEAIKAARAAEAKRIATLREKMKPWGRTSFALVVKKDAAGIGGVNIGSMPGSMPGAVHPHSFWGGTSRCNDTTPALLNALKRQHAEVKSKDLPSSVSSEKVTAVAAQLRKRLIQQQDLPLKSEEDEASVFPSPVSLRKRRFDAIATLLLEPERLKRYKLQPKREGKFLEKHIRRARIITSDITSKRHKDLMKSISNHSTEFYKFHRLKKTDAARLARAIRDQLNKEEKQKEKEAEQAERARIAALRNNDMSAYTSLLEDTKNDRLKFLLDKTDECMNQISTLLTSRAEEEEEEIRKAGGEGKTKASFSDAPRGGSYYETAHVKAEQVRQPSLLTGGDLKEYQLGGLQWMVSLYNNRLNGILADEMGLGKTIQTIALIAYLIEVKENLGPYLVIVPLSTLSNWVNEFAKWLPAAKVVCYKGIPQQRKELFRNEVADGHFNVLLTTYEFVIRDKASLRKLTWQYAIVDEGHRMKNNQSKFSVTLGKDYNTRRRVLLTGTPLQNSLPELWALLNFLLPAVFNSAETFDQWFNKPFSSFGKSGNAGAEGGEDSNEELLTNEERMLIIHRLHELLRPFMLRRVKSEVLDQLPEKVEKVIRCELSSWQKELYKQISHKIVNEAESKNFNRGLNNVVMQLRKVVNHPYLFNKEGYHINEDLIRTSGKMELLDRMLPKLKAAGHRVLMFTQMTKMMPILEDYFAYRGMSSLRLDGSTTADEREKRMYTFNAPDSPYFIFLLSTRAGGLGLNLATADTVIIFDSDWNPMMDLQAQDRAHRIGQRKDVRVFRIISQSPVEEKILSRATEKLHMNELVVEAGKFDKGGADEEGGSLERLKMMEILLTDFDTSQDAAKNTSASNSEEDFEKDGEDCDGENSGDLLNEMISSNDDDYKLYCKMDLAKTSAPALYSDIKDVPDWILYPNGKPEEGSELADLVLGGLPIKRRAAAGDIVYDDGLTEKQFCRMMDKKADSEEKGKKKRKKKRSRNAVDPSLIIDDEGGRKRAKTTPGETNITSSKAKGAAFGISVDKSDGVSDAMYERLVSICRSIIYYKEKGTNRKMAEIFLEKPCPTTYPDYYQVIEKPIGMNDILRKCRAKLYSSISSFIDDWNTLFKNAATYNGEGSWVAIDANFLKNELYRLMEKNNLMNTPSSKKPLRIKLSLKRGKTKKEVKDGEISTNVTSLPKIPKKAEQQEPTENGDGSDSSDSDDSGSEQDKFSDVVGMNEREATLSKRGKIKSGGLGSRGGTTRLVRR